MIDWLKMEDTDTFLYGIKRKSLILKFSLLNMYTAFIKSIFIITHIWTFKNDHSLYRRPTNVQLVSSVI